MKEVLFLIPARLTRPFFTQLYAECEAAIFEHCSAGVRPIIRAVTNASNQFDADEINRVLEREFSLSDRIEALIVVPTDAQPLSVAVERVSTEKGVPVVALTLPFFRWPSRRNGRTVPNSVRRPPLVICDSAFGTRSLAEVAAREFLNRNTKNREAHVVMMPGAKTRIDSRTRIASFRDGLATCDSLSFTETYARPGHWQRLPARDSMLEVIEHAEHPVDIAFAANDEMALGIRDAILFSLRTDQNVEFVRSCQVYGFDAIPEARSLIKQADYHFRGTVAQQIPLMAQTLAEVLQKVLNGEQPEPHYEIPPAPVFPLESVGIAILNSYPNVPPVNAEEWITAPEAAKIAEVEIETLKRGRSTGDKRADAHGKLGRDNSGRVWREHNRRIRYHAGTVAAAKNRRRSSR